MKVLLRVFVVLLAFGMLSCRLVKPSTKVVRPRYHATSPKNQYRIDIPVGARHIRMFERKRTKVVRMY